MKGQVLGFDGTTGAISAEDGGRYSFSKDAWKDEKPPAPRDQVDFVAVDGEARDIYRLRGSIAGSLPDGVKLDAAKTQAARSYAATRPQLLLAVIIIVASLFLTFMGSNEEEDCCVTVTSAHKLYGGVVDAFKQQARTAEMMARYTSTAELAATTERARSAEGAKIVIHLLKWVSYALWLLPLGAALIVFREVKGDRWQTLEYMVGFGSLAALLFLPVTKWAFGQGPNLGMWGLQRAAEAIGYGFGAFAIGLAGLGLLLTASGRISRTPGL